MKRLIAVALAIGGLVGVAVVGLLGAGAFVVDRLVLWVMPSSPFPRCTDDDKRFASALVTLGILDARPAGAEPYGGRRGGCNDDDRLAYAEQSYRVSVSLVDVPSFYREVAVRDGWRLMPRPGEGEKRICFAKVISGRDVYLSVWYSGGPEVRGGDSYFLQVGSGPGGDDLC